MTRVCNIYKPDGLEVDAEIIYGHIALLISYVILSLIMFDEKSFNSIE